MKKIDLKFAQLEVHDDFVICRARDGIDLDIIMLREMSKVVSKEIEGDWGLMLDMVNSFSIQLPAMHFMRDNQEIYGVAVVCYREASCVSMQQMIDIMRKPASLARSLSEARLWILKHRQAPEPA